MDNLVSPSRLIKYFLFLQLVVFGFPLLVFTSIAGLVKIESNFLHYVYFRHSNVFTTGSFTVLSVKDLLLQPSWIMRFRNQVLEPFC